MYATYTAPNGTTLTGYLYSDLMEGKEFRDEFIIEKINGNRINHQISKKLYKDDKLGLFFKWHDKDKPYRNNGYNIYLNDFNYTSASELLDKLVKDDECYVSEDEILASFIKESDNFRFILDMPVMEIILPSMGLYLNSGDYEKTICKLSEYKYPKSKWGYKISLVPVSEDEIKIGSRTFYFSDFVSMIKTGRVEIMLSV